MKKTITFLIVVCLSVSVLSQSNINKKEDLKMKLNAGITTEKIAESKEFYTKVLNFGVTFENEFYLLLHTPDKNMNLAFLLPNHPSQQALFQEPFNGKGMFLTIEVNDVDKIYNEIKKMEIEIRIDIRNESWGDRHFAIQDPNGIGIDIVKYTEPVTK